MNGETYKKDRFWAASIATAPRIERPWGGCGLARYVLVSNAHGIDPPGLGRRSVTFEKILFSLLLSTKPGRNI